MAWPLFGSFSPAQFALLSLAVLLCLAAYTDLRWRRIPNVLTGSGVVIAIIGAALFPGSHGLLSALGGLATGFGLLLPLYLLRGMAAGDVKLMAMVGAFLGPWPTVIAVLLTFLTGGIWGLGMVFASGTARRALTNVLFILAHRGGTNASVMAAPASVGSIPYGAVIAVAVLLLLALRQTGVLML